MSDKGIFTAADQQPSTEANQQQQTSQQVQGDPQNPLAVLVGEGRKSDSIR